MSARFKIVDGIEVPLSAEEEAEFQAAAQAWEATCTARLWANVRRQRAELLAACDWTQLPDAKVSVDAWRTYRQALRDITTQPDPANIAWPKQPV